MVGNDQGEVKIMLTVIGRSLGRFTAKKIEYKISTPALLSHR